MSRKKGKDTKTRKETVFMLQHDFMFPITAAEKEFIMDEENSDIRVENFVKDLYEKYLYPDRPKKETPKMVIRFKKKPNPTMGYLFD